MSFLFGRAGISRLAAIPDGVIALAELVPDVPERDKPSGAGAIGAGPSRLRVCCCCDDCCCAACACPPGGVYIGPYLGVLELFDAPSSRAGPPPGCMLQSAKKSRRPRRDRRFNRRLHTPMCVVHSLRSWKDMSMKLWSGRPSE